ncbi:hypothetical protein [Pedobacter hiemivivus]|uniref:Uncharacterized protein n=1 Tax=Pedobacter hiemivivus TaxID=2530454 RepID=A0A4R0N542_9SPHI|nr:hypothetical protein [Pedobacter hiemivivus]TCC95030.1 hypothetical protein EZ444_16115 [Pedobacter hiemivivus]
MKNFQKLAVSLAVAGLAIGFSAFTSVRVEQWTFKGSTTGQIRTAALYEQGLAAPSGCGSGANLPCVVNFPDGIDNEADLQTYLTAHTNTDVLNISPQKRN